MEVFAGPVVGIATASIVAVVAFGEVRRSRRKDRCVRLGRSRPLAPLEDVTVAAEILIDDAFTERPPASFAVGVNGS
ncbi:MAG: hypothetical protein ACLP22_06265 [Solirubrobacteraceae bacterium]